MSDAKLINQVARLKAESDHELERHVAGFQKRANYLFKHGVIGKPVAKLEWDTDSKHSRWFIGIARKDNKLFVSSLN